MFSKSKYIHVWHVLTKLDLIQFIPHLNVPDVTYMGAYNFKNFGHNYFGNLILIITYK